MIVDDIMQGVVDDPFLHLLGRNAWSPGEMDGNNPSHHWRCHAGPTQYLGAVPAQMAGTGDLLGRSKEVDTAAVVSPPADPIQSIPQPGPGHGDGVRRTCRRIVTTVTLLVPGDGYHGDVLPVELHDGVINRLMIGATQGHGDDSRSHARLDDPRHKVQPIQNHAPGSRILTPQNSDAVEGDFLGRSEHFSSTEASNMGPMPVTIPTLHWTGIMTFSLSILIVRVVAWVVRKRKRDDNNYLIYLKFEAIRDTTMNRL